MIYKTTKLQWPELHKKIKAFVKKLDKYEISYKFNVLGTSPERVTIYEVDPADRTTRYEAGFKIVDVITYEFECETLKLGDWTPCAVINHQKAIGIDNKPMNEVHSVNGYAILDDWYFIDSKCEHCHTNRFRSTTVMLVDNKGNYKQVGSTCVKDFTGIDAFDIVRSFQFVDEYMEEEPSMDSTFFYENEKIDERYVLTIDYLAHCIERIEHCGYKKLSYEFGDGGVDDIKESTKWQAFDRAFNQVAIDDAFKKQAEEMYEAFVGGIDDKIYGSYFYSEIAEALSQKFTHMDGLIAYAPVAYPKLLQAINEYHIKQKAAEKSEHYGNVGDKVDLQLTLVAARGFNTQFGWTNVYTFVDSEGRQFVWFTGKDYEVSDVPMNVKGTIKEHSEYDGMKQTVLTRCKIS